MSTRSTIECTDQWHLYEELMDEYPENIHLNLNRRDYDGSTIVDSFRIPWQAAVALTEYVQRRLEQEAKLRDPVYLQERITELQAELDASQGKDDLMSSLARISNPARIQELKERLAWVQNDDV